MSGKRIPRDPIAAYARREAAARRVGRNAKCICGEQRPNALIAGSRPVTSIDCKRKKSGKTTMERHHVAGRSNSPVTIPIPANDHKSRLSEDQYDWPRKTLENPSGSPLLRAAGCIRGLIDTISYLIDKLLAWIPELLELLDADLHEKLGPDWWIGTPLETLVPRSWRDA